MNTEQALSRFEESFARIYHLKNISGLLHWDMNTMMPAGSVEQRGEQMAFLEGQVHAAQSDPAFLESLETLAAGRGLSEAQLAGARWQLARAKRKARVPAKLVEALAAQNVLAQPIWVKARAEKNFSAFLPTLKKSMELAREMAACVQEPGQTRYEGLMAEFEPGARLSDVERLFGGLRKDLVPLLKRILERKRSQGKPKGNFALEIDKQVVLNKAMIGLCGFDFDHGRLDVSVHPFCGGAGSDIRLTSRYFPDDFTPSLFGALHECGHGMYEQGMDRLTAHRSLREAPGLGFHESQSRFWENHVGRSAPMVALIQEELAKLGSGVSREELFNYVNRVEPSYIRVEADEATYNLHILLRFEIESALIEGKLEPENVPDAWWAKAREYVGVEKKDDSQGCLQDIHWSIGLVGYFPTYTLGNLIAAQLDARMRKELDFPALAKGRRLHEIRDWLGREVHAHGCALPTLELAKKATGRELGHEAFVSYLEAKHLGGH
jgi:carboxypeptidase Taq